MKIVLFIGSAAAVGFVKCHAVLSAGKSLGYKEFIPSKKGREGELICGIFCLLIWFFIFCYDYLNDTITFMSSEFSALLLGGLCGISIGTIYTLRFMPKGIYERGILTETKAIPYKNINRISTEKTNNRKIIKVVFHQKESRALNLYVHEQDMGKIEEALRKHKLKIRKKDE